MGKGDKRVPRDDKYCTAQQYRDRHDAIDWGKKSKKQCCGRDHDHDGNCDRHQEEKPRRKRR